MLPLPAAITSQLDKASIIRLTISYLKLRDFSGHGDPPWNREGHPNNNNKLKGRNMKAKKKYFTNNIYYWNIIMEHGQIFGNT